MLKHHFAFRHSITLTCVDGDPKHMLMNSLLEFCDLVLLTDQMVIVSKLCFQKNSLSIWQPESYCSLEN